jgi:AP-1 complex subunit gamma-1
MELIFAMAHKNSKMKTVAYLTLANLIGVDSEVVVMIAQTILKDLADTRMWVQVLALTFIAKCAVAELSRACAGVIATLMGSDEPRITKRAGMAAVRITRNGPDLAGTFRASARAALRSGNHSVVGVACILSCELIKADPTLIEAWRGRGLETVLVWLVRGAPGREWQWRTAPSSLHTSCCSSACSSCSGGSGG